MKELSFFSEGELVDASTWRRGADDSFQGTGKET